MPNLIPPPHPGETILEDVLKPLDMSVNRLAKAFGDYRLPVSTRSCAAGVASPPIQRCVWRGISAHHQTSGSDSSSSRYDLRVAQRAKQKDIERSVRPRSEAA